MTEHDSNQTKAYLEWKSWDADKFGHFTIKERVQFAAEMKAAGASLTENTKLLEIGFGNAAFAGWVRDVTQHYVGTEANQELVTRAISMGIEAYPSTIDLQTVTSDRLFDLIVIFDVLEHLEIDEIITTLTSCRQCLSEEGRIILRVPSGDSPFVGPLMYGDITHKTVIGSKAVVQLATLTGLEVISSHDAAFPIFGLGLRIAMERLVVKALRLLIGKMVNAIFNGNTKAVMSNNMVSVLRVKRSIS